MALIIELNHKLIYKVSKSNRKSSHILLIAQGLRQILTFTNKIWMTAYIVDSVDPSQTSQSNLKTNHRPNHNVLDLTRWVSALTAMSTLRAKALNQGFSNHKGKGHLQ